MQQNQKGEFFIFNTFFFHTLLYSTDASQRVVYVLLVVANADSILLTPRP